MTMWIPDLSTSTGPRYKAIAAALAADIRDGKLKAGDRLPTHRDLAYRLGVTVGTITRAYAEAQRRGLLEGHVGRGSFLAQPANLPAAFGVVDHEQTDLIELSLAFPPPQASDALLQRTFADLEIYFEHSLRQYAGCSTICICRNSWQRRACDHRRRAVRASEKREHKHH